MKVGMSLPLMEPKLSAALLRRWMTDLDEGPFSTIGIGERIAYVNAEVLTTLGAVAALTCRIALMTTVIAATTHDPVRLAKQLATVDFLSAGRLSVGLGVGGREEDYRAVGADIRLRSQGGLARHVAIMRRVWAGDRFPIDALHPSCPPLSRPAGPPILSGAMGPKALRAAASWADTNIGWSSSGAVDDVAASFQQTLDAWRDLGRPVPRLITSFYFAVGDGARYQIAAHMNRYFDYLGPEAVGEMAKHVGFAGSPREMKSHLQRIADLGADEVILIPTDPNPDQVKRVGEIIASLA